MDLSTNTFSHQELNQLVWVKIPAGPFLIGAAESDEMGWFRTTHRGRHIPGDAGHNIGFRVVLNAES